MKKLTLQHLILMLILFSCFTLSFGQNGTSIIKRSPSGKIRCQTTEYENYLRAQDPNRPTPQQFESWLAPKIEEAKKHRNAQSPNAVITVPVVIHIISNGDAIGVNENITDAQALSQITTLNQDFRKMLGTPGYNTSAVGADLEIEFCLAQRKPDNITPTNGIDRVTKTAANYATMAATEALKTATQWDPTKYFNIWTVYFSDVTTTEMYGTLGYAQFPSTSGLSGLASNGGSASTDGLVVDYRCFGSSDIASGPYFTGYDKGRTATHEIGHCFGLIHIWGDANCGDDYCADTPTAHTSNFGCPTVTNCTSTGNEMVQNYMDYTDDTCMNIFTLNQKARMIAVMNNSPRRASLKTSNGCSPILATGQFEFLNSIQLYPNPAQNRLTLAVKNGELPDNYTIYNALGQLILSKKVVSLTDLEVNTSQFQAGTYYIQISKENDSKTLQFVKE